MIHEQYSRLLMEADETILNSLQRHDIQQFEHPYEIAMRNNIADLISPFF